jgi:MFS family permease
MGNAVSAVGGIVSPLVVSAFLEAFPGTDGWRCVFILTAAMSGVTLVLWRIFQTSTIVPALNTPGEIIK